MDENEHVQKSMDGFLCSIIMDDNQHVQESTDGFLCSIILKTKLSRNIIIYLSNSKI